MYREIKTLGSADKLFPPLPKLFTFPWRYCPFVNAQLLLRNYKIAVDTKYEAEPFAGRAGSKRIVERKQVGNWVFKLDPIQFKFITKGEQVFTIHFKQDLPFTFIK